MVLIVFRAQGDNWNKFSETVQSHRDELTELGARSVHVYKNRRHPGEWMMIQEWPDKARFDAFAASRGPEWDRQAGVRWTDVSTWEETDL